MPRALVTPMRLSRSSYSKRVTPPVASVVFTIRPRASYSYWVVRPLGSVRATTRPPASYARLRTCSRGVPGARVVRVVRPRLSNLEVCS